MMNNSKSKHSNDPTKSKPRGKQNKTKKSSKKKNADSDNNKEQDDAVSSSAGHYVNTLEQPLTRRPLSSTSNEDTVETVYAESNHVPLVIPKWEKPDTQRKSFHLARDPRMTSNPIMERDDDMDEDISNEAFPTDLTNNELVHTAEVLQSIIDINVENVKSEKDDIGLWRENEDWKTRFWSEANSTTEEPTAVPVVRIKSEPMDENAFNPSSEPIEDDRCSIDSGSIVGLPSPGRASPTPSLKNGEVNQTAGGISDDNETPRISPEQRLISSERKDDADVTPASGIQSGMTVQHLPPQQPAQPVAAQIPVIAQQNLIPVQASSSRNSGAPVPTLIQPSTSVLTQSNSMHPVVLLPPSAPLQQQSQPTPVVPIHGPPPLVPNRGLIPQHPHTPIKYLIKDWGIPSDTPAAPPATTTPRSGAATSSANDDWGSEADAWASGTSSKPTTPRAAPAASSSGGGGDDWSSAADSWASGSSSKTTTPSASKSDDPWSAVVNSGGSSYSSRGGGGGSYGSRGGAGGGRGGGGRPCFNCNEEGHMSRECPKPSTRGGGRGGGRGGSTATCYNCNEDGHMSRECPKPSTRGRGGGGRGGGTVSCYNCNEDGHMSRECPKPSTRGRGGGRGGGSGGGRNTCFKCNEEGHMSRDCPNGGSSGGGSRSRSSTALADDDWGTPSATSSSSPWATGANAAPRGRATPSAGKSNDDDWGAPAPPRGGSRSTTSASKSNDDDWGAPAPPVAGGRATPSASKSNDDDWGAAADSWSSVTGKSGGGDRGSRSSRSVAPSGDSWDTDATSKASASRGDDDWGSSTTAPGTTPRSGDGRRSSRPGGRSPRQMEMGDATPLYDE